MAKCLYCNKLVDREKEAHVVIPNQEQCGYLSRRPTKFVHAKCYEAETVRMHEEQKATDRAVEDAERAFNEYEASAGLSQQR